MNGRQAGHARFVVGWLAFAAFWLAQPHAGAATAPDAPPIGRSLFDLVFSRKTEDGWAYEVPFPFTKLLERLSAASGAPEGQVPFRTVFIPLGRALQRNAAAPDFFRSPRIVVAVDQVGTSDVAQPDLLLKDRLYIGYQAKSESLELISYNEAAGRFEFQVVQDYAPGKAPRVLYANRSLCLSCHQNAAPIFAEALWRESNANDQIAARLRHHGERFQGLAIATGPEAMAQAEGFSRSVQRANLIAPLQTLWREGCAVPGKPQAAVACRGAFLIASLQYLLSGRRHFDRESKGYRDDLVAAVGAAWR